VKMVLVGRRLRTLCEGAGRGCRALCASFLGLWCMSGVEVEYGSYILKLESLPLRYEEMWTTNNVRLLGTLETLAMAR
jgi:hypothetical protein